FLSLTRQIIFLIPLLLFLPNLWGADGVWFATPMADVLSVSCTIYLVWRERRLQTILITDN
ncbi:MAG: MATE family efflux transporter, partial [Bacteroidales bacterium]|nr:MATE family efflux transporter [Bacteroidales bacterium]